MKFLCIGHILCDMYLHPAGPEIFEDDDAMLHKLDAINIYIGGDAANSSTDLVKLGQEAAVSSAVGCDVFGNQVMTQLNEVGVNTDYVTVKKEVPTSVHTIVLRDGARGNTYLEGSAESIELKDIGIEAIKWADHVHLVDVLSMPRFDGDGKGVAEVMRLAKEAEKNTSMDLCLGGDIAPSMERLDGALQNCDIFLPSIGEVEAVLGTTDLNYIKNYFSKYPLKVFGVKLGKDGVFLTNYKEEYHLPSLVKGTPVDPLGAGDAFGSGFITAYEYGYDLKSCGLIASAASRAVCNAIGCSAGMVHLDVLLKELEDEGYTLCKK